MNRKEALKEIRFMEYLERKSIILPIVNFWLKYREDPNYWTKVREIAFGKESEVNGQEKSA